MDPLPPLPLSGQPDDEDVNDDHDKDVIDDEEGGVEDV